MLFIKKSFEKRNHLFFLYPPFFHPFQFFLILVYKKRKKELFQVLKNYPVELPTLNLKLFSVAFKKEMSEKYFLENFH